jgi:hypothetical protein
MIGGVAFNPTQLYILGDSPGVAAGLIEFFDKLYMNHCDCLVAHKNNALVEIIP